jgi:hypothetical protein
MRTPITLGVGVMPDVCATSSGWLVTYRILGGPLVVVSLDRDGGERARVSIAIGNVEGSLFPRVMVVAGRPFLAYPAWRGGAWWAVVRSVTSDLELGPENLSGGVHPADHPLGNSPVCLSADGWFGWQDADTMTVEGFQLHEALPIGRTLRGEVRPTGLATCTGGAIVFVDEVRLSVPGMANPVRAGACVVGENLSGGISVRMDDGRQRVLLSGDTFVPRVADGGAGTYAAVTWGPAGVQLQPFEQGDINQVHPPPPPNREFAMKKAEITVTTFTLTPAAHLPDGEVASFHDRENVTGAAVRLWVEDGSLRMSIDYPGAGAGLRGETARRRPVR